MHKYLLALALFFTGSSNAAILDVNSLSISGGTMQVGSVTSQLLIGDIQPMIMGEYQGAPACCSPAAALTSIVYHQFASFGWAGVHTSVSDINDPYAPPPSAYVDTDAGLIVADLSAWTWSFNGWNVHVGASDIMGSYDSGTGEFNLSWTTEIMGTVFSGQVQDWAITGHASVVPLPAAVWLFGGGLMMLFGLGRRRFGSYRRH